MRKSETTQEIIPNRSAKVAAGLTDLRWLVRYASHCGFHAKATEDLAYTLRQAFGAAAWRIVCRSPKEAFMPILRNQELSIHSLITYCKRLADRSFVHAPKPRLLAYFVRERRHFYDHPCRVPENQDYDIIRVANREETLAFRDIASVVNWADQTTTPIEANCSWQSLIDRACKHNQREQIRLSVQSQEPWHFHCQTTAWIGYTVKPITDAFGLWQEGQRQANCLYKLRFECSKPQPSRFFSVSRAGKPIATLELAWRPPESEFAAMDRVWGRWELQDLRLSYNRLGDAALVNSMHAFAGMYNIWAKRPKRHPTAQTD